VFWDRIRAIESDFAAGIKERDSGKVANALLEMDRAIWQGKQDLESGETISEAREILRDQIVVVGAALDETPVDDHQRLQPLVADLLNLRKMFRENKQFAEADALRDSLERVNIRIEDTPQGTRWRIGS
jgi:cysteinyl-tRNA synthetase